MAIRLSRFAKSVFLFPIITISCLLGPTAAAQSFGEEDDTYIGLQMTFPIGEKRSALVSGSFEFNALLINQRNRTRDGIVLTGTSDGVQALSYVTPYPASENSSEMSSNLTIPIAIFDENSASQSNYTGDMIVFVAGAVVIAALFIDLLKDSADCINPEVESEQFAGC